MSSADLATVVIACPNCGTRYQVPYGTLGPSGREVQCAQCGKPWHATADAPPPPPPPIDPDMLFTSADEAALDKAFEAEAATAAPKPPAATGPTDQKTLAEIRASIAPRPKAPPPPAADPALAKVRHAFDRRQKRVLSKLPFARFRRTARLGAFVALASLLVLGFAMRVDVVRWFPSLAGIYAAIGLPVNVVGLEFTDAKTLKTLREGKTVMTITAKIRSVTNRPVPVPPVLVSLMNEAGTTLYEWTAAAAAADLEPGEILDFSTEVNSPPDGATRVRLSFTTPRGNAG